MRFVRGEIDDKKYCIALTNSILERVAFIFKSRGWKFHTTYWGDKYSFIKWRK